MDKQTFSILVLENERQLYRIAKAILCKDEDCADAAQEAVAKGFAGLEKLKNDQYAKTWLIRILINECYQILRNRGRDLQIREDKAKNVREAENRVLEIREEYRELYKALGELPPELRIVLVMHYLEGYSVREIGEILELPEGTIKSRMARGRRLLKKLLI